MSLRLSTGFCHGLVLQSPAGVTRPTAGRVRAAVWNSLQEQLQGARVLDLFAGSGALGIEALSRGARSATFVEKDRDALKSLRINIEAVKLRAQKQALAIEIKVFGLDAKAALATSQPESFDIICLDPPYAFLADLLPPLGEPLARLAAPGCTLFVESHADDLSSLAAEGSHAILGEGWQLRRQKVYGKIGVSFFTRSQDENTHD